MVQPLLARVRNGRLILDEPTDRPEGSIVELIAVDDDMPPEERAALDAALLKGMAQVDRGETIAAEEVLRRLRSK